MIHVNNLYQMEDPHENSEIFSILYQNSSCKIESICSWLKTPGEFYNQTEDEWVLLIRGNAILEVDTVEYHLQAGDYCFIPKHVVHRVISTSKNAFWLGVFSS